MPQAPKNVDVLVTLDRDEAMLLNSAIALVLALLSRDAEVLGRFLNSEEHDDHTRRIIYSAVTQLIGRPDGLEAALDSISRIAIRVLDQIGPDDFNQAVVTRTTAARLRTMEGEDDDASC